MKKFIERHHLYELYIYVGILHEGIHMLRHMYNSEKYITKASFQGKSLLGFP